MNALPFVSPAGTVNTITLIPPYFPLYIKRHGNPEMQPKKFYSLSARKGKNRKNANKTGPLCKENMEKGLFSIQTMLY
jgi:hypothetical protein